VFEQRLLRLWQLTMEFPTSLLPRRASCTIFRFHHAAIGQSLKLGRKCTDSRILKDIASELAENCRAMAPEFLGNDIDADARRPPPRDLAAFIHVDPGVGAFHVVFLASDKP
jgi:hypothetical protein